MNACKKNKDKLLELQNNINYLRKLIALKDKKIDVLINKINQLKQLLSENTELDDV